MYRLMAEKLQRELDAQIADYKTPTQNILDASVWKDQIKKEHIRQLELERAMMQQRKRDEAVEALDYFKCINPEGYEQLMIAYRAMKRVTT